MNKQAFINGYKSASLRDNIITSLRQSPVALPSALLAATSALGAGTGYLVAEPNKGVSGALYGALQGLTIPLGVGVGGAFGASSGESFGRGLNNLLHVEGQPDVFDDGNYGKTTDIGAAIGAALGGKLGYHKMKWLYGDDRLKEIFG